MQHAFSLVERWCRSNELAINPTKFDLALFTNRRKYDLRLPHLSGYPVQISKTVKYLGVTFDSKLNWFAHVDCEVKKVNAILWQRRSAVGQNWGFSPKIMLWIFRTIVRPMLSHGCVVWSYACTKWQVQLNLQKLSRTGCLMITGGMNSTTCMTLQFLTGLLPLGLHIRAQAAGACYRLKAFKRFQGGQRYVLAKLLKKLQSFLHSHQILGLSFQT